MNVFLHVFDLSMEKMNESNDSLVLATYLKFSLQGTNARLCGGKSDRPMNAKKYRNDRVPFCPGAFKSIYYRNI